MQGSLKGLVTTDIQDRSGTKYTFFSTKKPHISHPNFPSNFDTPSENLPKISYASVYELLCVDNVTPPLPKGGGGSS